MASSPDPTPVLCRNLAFLLFLLSMSVPSSQEHRLKVTNDGPAVIGTPITFTATYPTVYESFIHEFRDKNNESISGRCHDDVSCHVHAHV